ncbi:MAG: hypothetical protein LBT40_15805 [Deltaproteobacteria bacterium]|jgi:hypothetical protein|nr:hypothetical protein [Deltaproteobacteria bacterium]
MEAIPEVWSRYSEVGKRFCRGAVAASDKDYVVRKILRRRERAGGGRRLGQSLKGGRSTFSPASELDRGREGRMGKWSSWRPGHQQEWWMSA